VSKRTNEEWLAELEPDHPQHETALTDLRDILVRGLERGLLNQVRTAAPEFHTQAEDFAQEALLKILEKKEAFAGRSQFTTWAHKIAVSMALTELRRKRWQDNSLDGLTTFDGGDYTPSFIADPSPAPENVTERTQMLRRINRLISEDLTEKQRTVIIASAIQGKSTDEIAAMMDMKPNAVYKLLHDARVRLKKNLSQEGLTPNDVLEIFD
jgi:RNA polymerase sigma-70 factor (ECF subfamily)